MIVTKKCYKHYIKGEKLKAFANYLKVLIILLGGCAPYQDRSYDVCVEVKKEKKIVPYCVYNLILKLVQCQSRVVEVNTCLKWERVDRCIETKTDKEINFDKCEEQKKNCTNC